MSESFSFPVVPKQFTQDYLKKYMIGGHAMKVKVFHPDYNEHREAVMKTVKDGRAAITRGWPRDARITHGGGHNMGIPLHLLQQPECRSPLSL